MVTLVKNIAGEQIRNGLLSQPCDGRRSDHLWNSYGPLLLSVNQCVPLRLATADVMDTSRKSSSSRWHEALGAGSVCGRRWALGRRPRIRASVQENICTLMINLGRLWPSNRRSFQSRRTRDMESRRVVWVDTTPPEPRRSRVSKGRGSAGENLWAASGAFGKRASASLPAGPSQLLDSDSWQKISHFSSGHSVIHWLMMEPNWTKTLKKHKTQRLNQPLNVKTAFRANTITTNTLKTSLPFVFPHKHAGELKADV